jgi:hypothetical protein
MPSNSQHTPTFLPLTVPFCLDTTLLSHSPASFKGPIDGLLTLNQNPPLSLLQLALYLSYPYSYVEMRPPAHAE